MDQPTPAPSSPPPSYAPPPAYAPRPQVVHVTARHGGFARALMFIVSLLLFGGVFALGLGLGAMMASASAFLMEHEYRAGAREKIAIIPIQGIIDGGRAEFVRAAVDRILKDGSIKAVVLRVDSPGGGVSASDQIWYQVGRLKQSKRPVLASYGGLAASGGYYVSCNADHITAEETCITGSIGVIAQVLTMEGLLDKVGIEPVTLVASGSPEKNVGNDVFRAWDERDRQRITSMLDSAYAIFLDRVQEGRGAVADAARLRDIADGSIYTAAEALEAGLVDAIGYLDDAIAEAERRAGLIAGRGRVIMLHEPPSLLGSVFAKAEHSARALDADTIRDLVNDLGSPRIMYLMR